jgi:hypothetical protein
MDLLSRDLFCFKCVANYRLSPEPVKGQNEQLLIEYQYLSIRDRINTVFFLYLKILKKYYLFNSRIYPTDVLSIPEIWHGLDEWSIS